MYLHSGSKKIQKFFLEKGYYATFQCGRYSVFKKKNFLTPQKKKKTPSKVAHNRPITFFFMYWPADQTSPELIFHVINMSQDASVLLSVE